MDYPKHWSNLLREHWKFRVQGKTATDPKVMLIEQARALYVPVPKAANSSARRALAPSVGIDGASVGDVHKDTRLPIHKWSEIEPRLTEDWFFFTIVRNPFTRILSAYRDKVLDRKVQLKALRAMGMTADDSFETFLKACARWPRKLLNDHFIPQADLLSKPLATGRLTVLKSEDLPDGWSGICDRLETSGVPRPDLIGHTNRAMSQRDSGFSDAEIALIQKLYADDFKYFSYSDTPPV
ncbi:sulfotransferase family 2 domain-containing protein [Qingshengfaniella alkalisoli]|uniref:Sulfotransferase family protein n=1 Tax=Qingshengfaniella alkalisoli TaxID=2599296 RepID=A0A5B8IRD9_9RHOB|nr:sulfotransferase family 2 domain-containing protein [Qingshengfaniella alkalisoli]QDY68762.1 sulfotransferase family protein [Qingshengfaniella alkalisoli]